MSGPLDPPASTRTGHGRHLLHADAARPALRGEMRRAVQRGEDPRLPARVHRRGGGRGRRRCRRWRRRTPSWRPTASTATPCCAACPPGRSWPRCTATSRAAAAAAAGRCTSSTPPPASTAATPSSPAACRWPSGWRWPTRWPAAPRVTVCFFGEGAVAEGEFHESLNLAALWQLPVLFCCENNLYAMGTALGRSESQTDIALKAAALRDRRLGGGRHGRARRRGGRPPGGATRSGPAAARTSWSCAPTGSGPTRCTTRSVTATRPRWPSGRSGTRSTLLAHRAGSRGPADATRTGRAMQADVDAEVAAAVEFAEAGTLEPVEELTRFVYSERGAGRTGSA